MGDGDFTKDLTIAVVSNYSIDSSVAEIIVANPLKLLHHQVIGILEMMYDSKTAARMVASCEREDNAAEILLEMHNIVPVELTWIFSKLGENEALQNVGLRGIRDAIATAVKLKKDVLREQFAHKDHSILEVTNVVDKLNYA